METGCANQSFRVGAGALLPDYCRAHEQATPVNKNGSNATGNPGSGGTGRGINASADGSRIDFFDAAGLPSTGGSSSAAPYVASRVGGSWTFNGTLPLTKKALRAEILGWDPEFTSVISSVNREEGLYQSDTATKTFERSIPLSENHFFPRLAGISKHPTTSLSPANRF